MNISKTERNGRIVSPETPWNDFPWHPQHTAFLAPGDCLFVCGMEMIVTGRAIQGIIPGTGFVLPLANTYSASTSEARRMVEEKRSSLFLDYKTFSKEGIKINFLGTVIE